MTWTHALPRYSVRRFTDVLIHCLRAMKHLYCVNGPVSLVLILLLSQISRVHAHMVVYTLSGEFVRQEWMTEDPSPDWEAFGATFAFDGHSEPIPHEDSGWFWYRPASWMRIDFRGRTWTGVNSHTCGELDMKEGYAGIAWGCTVRSDSGDEGRIYVDIRDASGITGPYFEPYPMGPFTPQNFLDFELSTIAHFAIEGDTSWGSVRLDDVRFIGEPRSISLLCTTSVALFLLRRRISRARPLRAARIPRIIRTSAGAAQLSRHRIES